MATRELKDANQKASTTEYGVAKLAAGGGTTAGTVVQGNDSRLTAAADLAVHIADASAAHAASAIAFTPAGTIAATTVQAAIEEVASEAGGTGPLDNFAATTDPAVTDDSGDGYAIGSRWINTTSDTEYVATDVSVGAAVWKRTTPGSGVTDAADVTYDNSTSGLAATDVQGAIDEVAALGGGGGGALVVIAEQILGADAATIDFTSIPPDYRDLELRVTGRGDRSGQLAQTIGALFNNDTGANYDTAERYWDTTPFAATSTDRGLAQATVGYLAGATATADSVGRIVLEIADYARTQWRKAFRAKSHVNANDGSSIIVVGIDCDGEWRSTAAITRVTLICIDGTVFKAGTVCSLYGIGAA